jgi:succinate dehydrogenase/fumarate reductase cytochrome b subunit
MKKIYIYLAVTLGLSAILGITSRLSVGFSEWYAMTIYPILVGTIGRFFGLFPFSATEFLIYLLIQHAIAGIVLLIMELRQTKEKKRTVFAKAGVLVSCVASTVLLIYITNTGINYNRQTFLYDQGIELKSQRSSIDEWKVFLTLLDEFYTIFPDLENQITTDENGVFVLSNGDLSKTAPAAMRNLGKQFPRLDLYYPRPKPVLFSGLMSDMFIGGFYSPFTIEAQYNNLAPDSDKAIFALHELTHVAGFMREDEANFIAFLAGRESGNIDLMYAAYLDVFDYIGVMMDREKYEQLPDSFKALFDRFMEKSETEWREATWIDGEFVFGADLLPEQMRVDKEAQREFWWLSRHRDNPVVQAMSDVSSAVNDTYLRLQGQEDGIASYGMMIDLVMAVYLAEITG